MLFTKTCFDTGAFANALANKCLYAQVLLRRDAFTRKRLYSQTRRHFYTDALKQRRLYTGMLIVLLRGDSFDTE